MPYALNPSTGEAAVDGYVCLHRVTPGPVAEEQLNLVCCIPPHFLAISFYLKSDKGTQCGSACLQFQRCGSQKLADLLSSRQACCIEQQVLGLPELHSATLSEKPKQQQKQILTSGKNLENSLKTPYE